MKFYIYTNKLLLYVSMANHNSSHADKYHNHWYFKREQSETDNEMLFDLKFYKIVDFSYLLIGRYGKAKQNKNQ